MAELIKFRLYHTKNDCDSFLWGNTAPQLQWMKFEVFVFKILQFEIIQFVIPETEKDLFHEAE